MILKSEMKYKIKLKIARKAPTIKTKLIQKKGFIFDHVCKTLKKDTRPAYLLARHGKKGRGNQDRKGFVSAELSA
jgi:hypothetical protein